MTINKHGPDREAFGGLSEDEVENIVERVTARVVQNFYQEVGKDVVSKILWVIGLGTVVLFTWLGLTGKLPK